MNEPVTIIVPDNYTTIQAAITAASPGSTIFVRQGIYYENVFVGKNVSLVGEDRHLTIIDGNGEGTVIDVSRAVNIGIYGFTIRNSSTNQVDPTAGISLLQCRGCVIRDNIIVNNYDGIDFLDSDRNVVSGNIISSNNRDGIRFYFSDNNTISGNTVSLNNNSGIFFDYYNLGNIFYHNSFSINTMLLADTISIWDYNNEGNYWSYYTGQDSNSDGIGDGPYIINSYNRDNYPLMGMFSDFNITSMGEAQHITVISNSTVSNFRFEIGAETGSRIIRFTVTGKSGTIGFCRVKIPAVLMSYPYVVLVDSEEVIPNLLNVSNGQCVYLYFSYKHSTYTVTIISPKALNLYNELLEKYLMLQMDLDNLNITYHDLLSSYSFLFGNYSLLQENYRELNSSYLEHLLRYSESEQNIQSLGYIFAITTAIFIITAVYLSKHAHRKERQ